MTVFKYDGPVQMFGRVICSKFRAQTTADGAKKALNNIAYQYKKTHGLMPSAKVTVDAKYLS